jgi:integrase
VLPDELNPALRGKPGYHPKKAFSFMDAVELYLKDESFKSLVYESKLRYVAILENWRKHFGKHKAVSDITVPDLKVYRTNRLNDGITNATANKEMTCLSSVFRVLVEHGIVQFNICHNIKRLNESSGEREVYLSRQDVERIKGACPVWFQPLITVAQYSGMRLGEIMSLRWEQVELKNRMIRFHMTEVKERVKSKHIPIHYDLMPVFHEANRLRSLKHDYVFCRKGGPITTYAIRHVWPNALIKIKWDKAGVRFHDLRHTFEDNARLSGIAPEIREAITGHCGNTKSVRGRYMRFSDNELITNIDKLTLDHGDTVVLLASNG